MQQMAERHHAAALLCLALAACGQLPAQAPVQPDSAEGFGREVPAHWITLREPEANELVVVVNNNGFWGGHAGLMLGTRLSDPAGSYHHRRARLSGWLGPSLADYVKFQTEDGLQIETYRFTLAPADAAAVLSHLPEADAAAPLYCATAVLNAIAGIGPFAGLTAVGWITPAALAQRLRPLVDAAAGTCEQIDANPCPAP